VGAVIPGPTRKTSDAPARKKKIIHSEGERFGMTGEGSLIQVGWISLAGRRRSISRGDDAVIRSCCLTKKWKVAQRAEKKGPAGEIYLTARNVDLSEEK